MTAPTTLLSDGRRSFRMRLGVTHRLALLGLLVGSTALATPVSILARDTAHPVSAAVVFVIVILVNGAVGGLPMGLLSSLVASVIFNFFLRFPVYQFGFASIDDVVPLIAFTVTAIVSGALSGRLADRARAAEAARHQLEQLLWFSNDLQRATTLDGIGQALVRALGNIDTARAMFGDLVRAWPRADADSSGAPAVGERRRDGRTGLDPAAALTLLRIALDRHDLVGRRATAQAELEAEQFKTALLSCVSHDLRTPLAVISASASGLARYSDSLDADTRTQMLTTIEEQCDRLKDFVERMLQLSRLDAGLSRQELQPTDVEEAVQSAVRRVRQANAGRRIRCTADECQMISLGHPDLLVQAVLNVIENAVRYSAGDDVVSVRLSRQRERIRLVIEDEGRGIAPADLPHVFERFRRGGNVGGREGMGLGLSFARDFIVFMGGAIDIESPGACVRGTTVVISLPAIDGKPMEASDA